MIETINYPARVKARKIHMCDWCGCEIKIGEIHHHAVYKYDEIYQWRNHLKCMELVLHLKMEGDCGVTESDFQEYIKAAFNDIWREKNNDFYQSKDFIIPNFKGKVDFVYNNLKYLKEYY